MKNEIKKNPFELDDDSLKHLASIIRYSEDAIISKDLDGIITSWNEGARKLYGYTEREMIGKPISTIFSDNKCEEDRQIIEKIKNGEIVEPFETERRCKDGTVVHISLTVSPIKNSEGEIIGASAIGRDITFQKEGQEKLKKMQERLGIEVNKRTRELEKINQRLQEIIVRQRSTEQDLKKFYLAIKHSPSTVVITDKQGKIEYVNPKFTQVTGYTSGEAIGQNPRIMKSGVHSEAFYSELWDTISTGRPWRGEFCNKRKSGEMYWELASIAPLKDQDGNIINYVAVKEDITDRKHHEEQLQRAKDDADMANRAKSTFLANMSHELRTPLNSIIGFSNILKDQFYGELNDKQKRYVHNILQSGKHLLDLINDILDLSKVEAGKMDLNFSLVSPKVLLNHGLSFIKEKAIKHGLRLRLNISRELEDLEMYMDERKVLQIMINLLSNAAKFTPDGGWITVDAQKKKDQVQISVTDSGGGIPEEEQEKIFEAFYQRFGERTNKSPGTGLGLKLTRRFVEMHGGKIWVKSKGEGFGSRFSFTLPIKRQTEASFAENKRAKQCEVSGELNLILYISSLINEAQKPPEPFVLIKVNPELDEKLLTDEEIRMREILRGQIRDRDVLLKGPNGSFIIVMKRIGKEKGMEIFNRIRKNTERNDWKCEVVYAISCYPDDGGKPDELLEKLGVK